MLHLADVLIACTVSTLHVNFTMSSESSRAEPPRQPLHTDSSTAAAVDPIRRIVEPGSRNQLHWEGKTRFTVQKAGCGFGLKSTLVINIYLLYTKHATALT